jgi:hypothetical protein
MGIAEFKKASNGTHYWKTFAEKVRNDVALLTKDGHVTIDKSDKRWGFLKNANSFDANAQIGMEQFKKGRGYSFPKLGGGEISLGAILKVNVSVGSPRKKYNLGNVAEGILAFAITARFLNKNKRITEQDLVKVLNAVKPTRSGTSSGKIFQSPNAPHPKMRKLLFDDVKVVVNLTAANMDMLFTSDPDEYVALKELMPACISYANSQEINTAALMMYRNGKKDYIDVIADGIGDETGTKVDVNLIINNSKNISIPGTVNGTQLRLTQISLKKDVDQFAQVGGWTLDKMDNLWGKILDSKPSISSIVQQIYADSAEMRGTTEEVAAETMRRVYTWADGQLQQKFNNKVWLENFVEVLDNFATYKEENVALVEIKGDTFHRYDFKKLKVALVGFPDADVPANLKLSSDYVTGASGLPTVRVSGTNENDNKKYELVQFRFKMEKGTGGVPKAIRNYVEKRSGLEDYIG